MLFRFGPLAPDLRDHLNAERIHYDLGGPKPPVDALRRVQENSAPSALEALPESMRPTRRTIRQSAHNERSRARNRQVTMDKARAKNRALLGLPAA